MNREEIEKAMSALKDAMPALNDAISKASKALSSSNIAVCESKAYNKGLEDAWELAKKLWLPTGYGGLEHTEVMKVFECDYCLIAKNYTPQEALAKIEAYEKEQEEIKVGDNDTLSALVAANVGAEMLIILSDIDGLYTADPRKNPTAKRIERVTELTEEIMALGGGEGSALGTGGMRTKLHAAEICMAAGVTAVIAHGEDPTVLYRVLGGENVGTVFGGKV